MGQWSELLPDLLMMVHEHLQLYPDKITFSCVCKHWQHSTSPAGLPDLRQPQPPWLLLPYAGGSSCGLYHPFEKKVYEIDLPDAGEKVFVGSGHGWVVTMQLDGSINVLNPLTRIRIPLPPRYTFPDAIEYRPDFLGREYYLKCLNGDYRSVDSKRVRSCWNTKIALSCSPTRNDFIAVALYDSVRLANCKIGDEKWHDFDHQYSGRYSGNYYRDITFLDGKLYAMTPNRLMICDDIASCPKFRECAPFPLSMGIHTVHYYFRKRPGCSVLNRLEVHLINSSRGLMIVRMSFGSRLETKDSVRYAVDLKIFKLDEDSSSWTPIERLDDEILFVGIGIRLGFSSQNFRGSNGNRTYFAGVRSGFEYPDCFDHGVFNVDDGSIKPLEYEGNVPEICHSPIWVTPNPY